MMRLATLAFVGLVLLPGWSFGQGVVVTNYAVPAVAVPAPVTTVTTYYPTVSYCAPAPAVSYYTPVRAISYYTPATVTYRQPLLRPRTTVARVRPATIVESPLTTASYSYTVPAFP